MKYPITTSNAVGTTTSLPAGTRISSEATGATSMSATAADLQVATTLDPVVPADALANDARLREGVDEYLLPAQEISAPSPINQRAQPPPIMKFDEIGVMQ
jgi:hypothetical protein